MLCVALSASLGLPSAQARPSTPEIVSQGTPDPAPSALAVQNVPTALAFVPAGGRGHNDDFRFEVRGAHGTLFLTPRETVFALPTAFPPRQPTPSDEHALRKQAIGIVRQRFLGAAPHPKLSGLEQQPTLINEYLGERSEDWRTNLPSYGAVQYYAVYPGIDLRYDGVDGQLKRSFLLAPGADASQIRWQYQGVDSISIDPASGDMQLQVMVRLTKAQQDALDTAEPTMPITMTERAPRAWQETPQGRVNVPVQFVLEHGHQVGFTLGAYDHSLPLVIDPEIFYWAGFEESQSQGINDMVLTPEVNDPALLFLGRTTSTAFGTLQGTTTQVGMESIYVSKRQVASGSVTWYTYFGGGTSSTINQGTAIATDASGNALITGSTSAAVFPRVPTTAQACSTVKNVFVSRLQASTGTLTASRCLGLPVSSSSPNEGRGIAVDPQSGAVWVTGVSGGGDFLSSLQAPQQLPRIYGLAGPGQPVPVRPTVPHGFLVKLTSAFDAAQTRIYFGTFLAGATVTDLALDGQGRPVVVGRSVAASSDDAMGAADRFPSTATGYQTTYSYGGNFYDGYVMLLSADGQSKVYGSWLGDVSTQDDPWSVTVGRDATDAGDLYVAGATTGSSQAGQRSFATPPSMDNLAWLTLRGSNRAGFVVRINPAASGAASLRYGSLLRSTGSTQYIVDVRAVAAHNGVAYLVGDSQQGDMLLNPVQASTGGTDAFVAALDTTKRDMPLSSYLGSTGIDEGHAVEMLNDGSVLVGGQLHGYTSSLQAYLARIASGPATIPPQAPNPPGYTVSYYVQSFDDEISRYMGCLARKKNVNSIVVLDFGNARQWNATTFGVRLVQQQNEEDKDRKKLPPIEGNMTDIKRSVSKFIEGFVKAQNCVDFGITILSTSYNPLTIAVGISNAPLPGTDDVLNPSLGYNHGAAWGQMVLDLQTTIKMLHYSNINVVGAFDAEPKWWADTGGFAPTKAWAQGFMSVDQGGTRYGLAYYVFGSLDGKWRDSAWQSSANPGYEEVYTINRGIPGARSLPLIYNSAYAKEWYQLRSYTIIRNLQALDIAGIMTECASSACRAYISSTDPWAQARLDLINPQDVAYDKDGKHFSPDIEDLSPAQGWYALWDSLHRTLITDFSLPARLPPNTTGWFTLAPRLPQAGSGPYKPLTFPATDPSCRPQIALYYNNKEKDDPDGRFSEPNNRFNPLGSCYPANTIFPTDSTFASEFKLPDGSQPIFNPLTPQAIPWITDIAWGPTALP